ncbi:hypothetical protein F4780DRAFT_372144 [Xylariomycetidae sp. FL0641]|nr:hypothetical protein F4780DRAFT_372144 [Xylariomycetidae sp. FL0641]
MYVCMCKSPPRPGAFAMARCAAGKWCGAWGANMFFHTRRRTLPGCGIWGRYVRLRPSDSVTWLVAVQQSDGLDRYETGGRIGHLVMMMMMLLLLLGVCNPAMATVVGWIPHTRCGGDRRGEEVYIRRRGKKGNAEFASALLCRIRSDCHTTQHSQSLPTPSLYTPATAPATAPVPEEPSLNTTATTTTTSSHLQRKPPTNPSKCSSQPSSPSSSPPPSQRSPHRSRPTRRHPGVSSRSRGPARRATRRARGRSAWTTGRRRRRRACTW